MKRRPPPHLRADTTQRAAVRAEMHAHVDRAVDDWPTIEQFAADVGWGQGVGADHTKGSGVADPTLSAVLAMDFDPHHRWMRNFWEMREKLRDLDGERARLRPVKPKQERENSVDICESCKDPNPKMKRIDGLPYCASSCYYREWRRRQGATG